jgi:hypothetical protein
MSLSNFRGTESLYTIIMRDPTANDKLIKWSRSSRSVQAKVEDNRMYIYDHNTLSLFIVTWSHTWDNILIWDHWTKRHLII